MNKKQRMRLMRRIYTITLPLLVALIGLKATDAVRFAEKEGMATVSSYRTNNPILMAEDYKLAQESLPQHYEAMAEKAEDQSQKIYEAFPDLYDEKDHLQAERVPAFVEFLVRRERTYPAIQESEYSKYSYQLEGYPYFIQWDVPWGMINYAGGYYGKTGCGPTCLAIVYNILKPQDARTPLQMAEFATQNKYITLNAGTPWTLFSEGAGKLGLNVQQISTDPTKMKQQLEAGKPLVLALGPGDFTSTGHYVVVVKFDKDGFVLLDPFNPANTEKRWSFEQLKSQIRTVWAFSA